MCGTSATLLVAAASLVLVCSSPSVGHADGLPRPLPLRMSTTGYERRGWERSLLLPALRGGSSRADGGAAAAVGADFDADDLTGLQDSSDIPSEGTAKPGAGVQVEEGYMERKRREHEQLWREDSRGTLDPEQLAAERDICPTWEDVVLEREQFFAEHPDFIEPLNETWFFEIRRGNVSTINQLVLQGAKVEWVDEYGDRAIHLAAIDNSSEVLRLLIAQGADIDAKNELGNTALHIATEYAQLGMMSDLISAGANLEARNRAKATAIVTASVHGHAECVHLLAAAGADIHTRALKDTPALHFAAAGNHAAAIRALIARGADPNATTPLGRNAMDWAYYSNETAAVAELAKYGVPVQDGGMLPRLELQKWAKEKQQRAQAKLDAQAQGRAEPVQPATTESGGWFPRCKAEPLVLSPLIPPQRFDIDGKLVPDPTEGVDLVREA